MSRAIPLASQFNAGKKWMKNPICFAGTATQGLLSPNDYCTITVEMGEKYALLTVKFTELVWLKSSVNEIVNFRISHFLQQSLSKYCRPVILTTVPRSLEV